MDMWVKCEVENDAVSHKHTKEKVNIALFATFSPYLCTILHRHPILNDL